MTFAYAALQGSALCIHSFSLTLEPGIKSLRAESIIEVAKVSRQSLEKLKQVVKDFEEPEEFFHLEGYDIAVEDYDEEFWYIVISCEAESLGDFPSVKQLSRVVKKLFKNAGI